MTDSPNVPPSPPPGAPGAKLVSCPGCGASIPLRALGQSVVVACPSCGSEIDVSRPDIRLIQKYSNQMRLLHIPLGKRGKVRGQLFEVIGAMQRSSSGYRWEEYLLFNPTLGFRWLVYDHGHWNFGQMIKDTSAVHPERGLPYQGHTFRKYNQDPIVVDWVVGEFYWRVSTGERVLGTDYICPPLMLSCEQANQETTWTLLTYLEPREVEMAFSIQGQDRRSSCANQPNSAGEDLRSLRLLAFCAIVIAFLVQLFSAARSHGTSTQIGSYNLIHNLRDETQVYGPFTLTANHSIDELFASAPLNNSWVQLDCTLVNTVTAQSIHFTNAFEYYSGYDSDGSWTDGSRQGHSTISNVPAGTYNLIVEGSSGDQQGRPVNAQVELSLEQDVTTWRNFWVAVCLILLYPIYLMFRGGIQERQRWSDSRYSPYSKS